MNKWIVGTVLSLLTVGGIVILQAQVTRDITLTIASGIASDVVDAYADQRNYRVDIPNPDYCPQDAFDLGQCTPLDVEEWIPNPESKQNFALRQISELVQEDVRNVYVQYKTSEGADAAQAAAEAAAAGITVQ